MMDNELIHEGVKGMRWGIRNGPPYPIDENTNRRKERRYAKQARRDVVRERRNLSDEDLNAIIKRLQSERQLKELSDKDLYPGKTQVKQIISDVGVKTITSVLTTSLSVLALYAIGSKLGKTKFDAKDVGGAILKKAIGAPKETTSGDNTNTDEKDKKDKDKK